MGKLGAAALAALVGSICLVSTVHAEVRTTVVLDPQDAAPTVSGVPNTPDIKQVSATYDTAGTIRFVVEFFNTPEALDLSSKYAFIGEFVVGRRAGSSAYPYCGGGAGTISYGQHHIFSMLVQFYDRATVEGYEGFLEFSRSTSPDGRTVTVSASSPVLANRDYTCFTYRVRNRHRSSASDIYSDYDSSCACWYRWGLDDVLGRSVDSEDEDINYFDGYEPVPPAPPEQKPKVKTRIWINPVGKCRRVALSSWTLLPDKVHGAHRGWPGKLRFRLRSRGKTKTMTTRVKPWISWGGLKPGNYRLQTRYLGDRWRHPATDTDVVRIKRC